MQNGNATAVVMEGRTAALSQAESKVAFARDEPGDALRSPPPAGLR